MTRFVFCILFLFLCVFMHSQEGLPELLKKAKKFIFIEFFIIEPGFMWNTILYILREKAKQGVEVKIIYDSLGSISLSSSIYEKYLSSLGIQAKIFLPFVPILDTGLNNRDHRKICVIDGNIGFTGGINLADEYINEKIKYGHWKDTAILVKGDAVWRRKFPQSLCGLLV